MPMTSSMFAKRTGALVYAPRAISPFIEAAAKAGRKIRRFNLGDPAAFGFAAPPHIIEAAQAALKEQKHQRYLVSSRGDPCLVDAIAAREKVHPDSVFVTNGLTDGIDMVIGALVNPGDNILLPTPCYSLYESKVKFYGGIPKTYACHENWEPDTKDIERKITRRTKAIVIVNPNNPTGAIYSRHAIMKIMEIASRHRLLVFADLIYDQLAFNGASVPDIREFASDCLLVCGNGISKNYFFPGARVGYLAVHGKESKVKNELKKILLDMCFVRLSPTNAYMQQAALAAFTNPSSHLATYLPLLEQRSNTLVQCALEIDGFKAIRPQGAFYSFIKLPDSKEFKRRFKTDKEFVYGLVEQTGIATVQGSGFLKPGYFRTVNLAPPDEIKQAFSEIRDFVQKEV
ncbi:aminotransferase class I/II-fold pyridoxal phosphate-dependent enzyme [Candidatus Parvarchaeota archaeon]|nr:aminotransferase class I/II-fold pyridoxal phosphate-dependent enzyme [Candidatus Parvarchaeota archaeon]